MAAEAAPDGAPPGGSPADGPETPDQEAQREAQDRDVGKRVAEEQQQAFDTMRSKRAFVAGMMAQGANKGTLVTQSGLGSNLS